MPRLTNRQMRISAAEKGRLRLDRQSQRDRRRARINFKRADKLARIDGKHAKAIEQFLGV